MVSGRQMQQFTFNEDISFVDTCIFLHKKSKQHTALKKKYLIIGDVHIGFEEALNKQGILIPRTMTIFLFAMLKKIIFATKPDVVVINGDLKHEFGTISRQEWKETLHFIEIIEQYVSEIVIIKGNHDSILEPITSKKNIIVKPYLFIGNVYITHGNKIPDDDNMDFKKAKTVIIGHEHPAITITDGTKHEKFKAFLVGTFKTKKLIVHPSFHPTEGTDVTKERLLSPFLKSQPVKEFEAFLLERDKEEIYPFGKIKDIALSKMAKK